jgi:uncharacterized protein YneR
MSGGYALQMTYLKSLEMKISREKNKTFQLVANRDTWFMKDPEIIIEDNPIPPVDTEEAVGYLGAKMGP